MDVLAKKEKKSARAIKAKGKFLFGLVRRKSAKVAEGTL